MCAPGNSSIRLRLFFDYPPPSVVSCRKCWLLVDLNTCRVVADLESVIRDKFEFSRGSILSLFIEDCYLPHTESIYVVRDNDSVRVKVDSLTNGHSSCPETTETCRKRPRTTEEDGPAENGVEEWKKKKRKKRSEETTEEARKLVSGDDGEKKLQKKHTEKKKKKVEKVIPTVKPAASPKKTLTGSEKPAKSSKKSAAKPQKPSSSDSSSSSEEDEPPRNTKTPSTSTAAKPPPNSRPVQKKPRPPPSSSSETDSSSSTAATKPPSSSSTATKPASSSSSTAATKPPSSSSTATKPASSSSSSTATKPPPNSRPVQKKPRPPPSSSSETDSSSSDEDPEVKTKPPPALTTRSQVGPPVLESTNGDQDQAGGPPQDSDSEEEDIQLVIRRPLLPAGFGVGSPGRGRGRGQGRRGGGFRGSFGPKEASYETDLLSNVSVVLQNGVQQDAPRRDYSSLPLLAAPPAVGQNIAFKLLELTENYTPEVSEYKEGKIVSFDPTTKQIELELLNSSQAPVEPGKFDLVYQNPDGSESVEYAVSRGSWVTERWESLLEPRLII